MKKVVNLCIIKEKILKKVNDTRNNFNILQIIRREILWIASESFVVAKKKYKNLASGYKKTHNVNEIRSEKF